MKIELNNQEVLLITNIRIALDYNAETEQRDSSFKSLEFQAKKIVEMYEDRRDKFEKNKIVFE